MNSGEIASIATIVIAGFSFLGVTGIDAGMVSQVITGVVALIGVCTAIWSHYKRPSAPAQQ